MTTTWNQHVVKKNNKFLVLQTIKDSAPLSRADIAMNVGLNKGTVSSLVSELLDEQLILETGPGESSGGRRPVMLLFNQQAGYSIGIDLGVHYILGVLTDLQGKVIIEKQLTYGDLSYEQIIDQVKQLIQFLLDSAPQSPYGVIGIGIGVPGIVDNDGKVLLAPNLGWKNVHLQQEIELTFHLPVIIDNEANAGAYGEKRFGSGQDSDDLVYVSAGAGIGVGLILNGDIYRGINGFSGEMGHMIIDVNGRACNCGSKGCWELYASEQALLQEAQQAGILSESPSELTLERLIQFAEENKQEVIGLFEKIGYFLGIGMNNILNSLNPRTIIIGNRLASADKWLREPIEQVIQQRTLPFQQEGLHIQFSGLSIYSTALGIAAFTSENFISTKNNETIGFK